MATSTSSASNLSTAAPVIGTSGYRRPDSHFSAAADRSDKPTILVNIFDVDPKDQDDFKAAWKQDAEFFCAQPGCLSAQLHQGIEGSRMFLDYAVFEDMTAFATTNQQPEFGPRRALNDASTSRSLPMLDEMRGDPDERR